MSARLIALAGAATVAALAAGPATATPSPGGDPSGTTTSTVMAGDDNYYVGVVSKPVSARGGAKASSPRPPSRVVSCGPVAVRTGLLRTASDTCGQVRDTCSISPAQVAATDPEFVTQARQSWEPGGWVTDTMTCDAIPPQPQVTPVLIAQLARRWVPSAAVGIAPAGGHTLVNIQTLLWVDTPARRTLAPVVLLGRRIVVSIQLSHVSWDFGDGTRDITDRPEPAYNPDDHCRTVLCPGYWGHVYTESGLVTITAGVVWGGSYTVDGGAPQPIPGTVIGPTRSIELLVRQARAILVDPSRPQPAQPTRS